MSLTLTVETMIRDADELNLRWTKVVQLCVEYEWHSKNTLLDESMQELLKSITRVSIGED